MDFNQLFPIFASLVGFPALVTAVVNVAKNYGWISDGSAPKVVGYLTFAGFVGVAVAYFTGNLPLVSQVDTQLGSFATFLLTFAAFVGDLGLAKVYHAGLRGTPFIGKSFSK